MEPFSGRRWRLVSAQVVSSCIYEMLKQYLEAIREGHYTKFVFQLGRYEPSSHSTKELHVRYNFNSFCAAAAAAAFKLKCWVSFSVMIITRWWKETHTHPPRSQWIEDMVSIYLKACLLPWLVGCPICNECFYNFLNSFYFPVPGACCKS